MLPPPNTYPAPCNTHGPSKTIDSPEFKDMVAGFTNNPTISEKDLNGILWEDWCN